MKTEHINNLISLVENDMADALNGNSENVAKAIKHINNTDLYGDLPIEVKNLMNEVPEVITRPFLGGPVDLEVWAESCPTAITYRGHTYVKGTLTEQSHTVKNIVYDGPLHKREIIDVYKTVSLRYHLND